jgi:signal transduction histidine kinase
VQVSPELADAVDVLDGARAELVQLSRLLRPHLKQLDRPYERRLRQLGLDTLQRSALAEITTGAAARIWTNEKAALPFVEQVEYNGRRLAKLNLAPNAILQALHEYDRLLLPVVERQSTAAFDRVRETLHFGVVLTLNNAYYQVREAETRAFYELFHGELESRHLGGLLRRFIDCLATVCKADAGRVYLRSADGKRWEMRAATGDETGATVNRPGLVKMLSVPRQFCGDEAQSARLDPAWQKRFKTCWSVPLLKAGKLEGLMQFGFVRHYEWLPRELELLTAAAERCVMATEKARLMEDLAQREEQVRRLAEHMLHVEEMERRRISRELHDEAGQSLLCIRLQMELIELDLPENAAESRGKLREARDLTERTILEMRRLIAALSPAVLEQLGLGAALRQLVNRFQRLHLGCRVNLKLQKMGKLPHQLEVITYRLVQECFNNIGKHAQATLVSVSLISSDGLLRLVVEDNGVGFCVAEALARRESFGLSGMHERVALLGGRFRVESRREKPRRGTKIFIELPISE